MRKLALWPRTWCISGSVSNSLWPCEMKDVFCMVHLVIWCFATREFKQFDILHNNVSAMNKLFFWQGWSLARLPGGRVGRRCGGCPAPACRSWRLGRLDGTPSTYLRPVSSYFERPTEWRMKKTQRRRRQHKRARVLRCSPCPGRSCVDPSTLRTLGVRCRVLGTQRRRHGDHQWDDGVRCIWPSPQRMEKQPAFGAALASGRCIGGGHGGPVTQPPRQSSKKLCSANAGRLTEDCLRVGGWGRCAAGLSCSRSTLPGQRSQHAALHMDPLALRRRRGFFLFASCCHCCMFHIRFLHNLLPFTHSKSCLGG